MKVGHKQVVGLIRQGGNRLVMKVVSVTRKPEEDGARRRGEGSDCCLPGSNPWYLARDLGLQAHLPLPISDPAPLTYTPALICRTGPWWC